MICIDFDTHTIYKKDGLQPGRTPDKRAYQTQPRASLTEHSQRINPAKTPQQGHTHCAILDNAQYETAKQQTNNSQQKRKCEPTRGIVNHKQSHSHTSKTKRHDKYKQTAHLRRPAPPTAVQTRSEEDWVEVGDGAEVTAAAEGDDNDITEGVEVEDREIEGVAALLCDMAVAGP